MLDFLIGNDALSAIVAFGLVLIPAVFIHELGHFLAAKAVGIAILEFGIGFPPRLAKLFRWGETDFTLNWLPLGGFVRPKGENDPTVPGGLAAASPWRRLFVLVSGPGMNLLTAVVIYAIIFSRVGVPDTSRVLVASVSPAGMVYSESMASLRSGAPPLQRGW